MQRRHLIHTTVAALSLFVLPTWAQSAAPDLSPEQTGRPRSGKVEEAIRQLNPQFKFSKEGALVVGTTTGRLPFGAYATDNKTPVGNAPDIAQLVADSLGRRLELVSVAWADWPLGLQSGTQAPISQVVLYPGVAAVERTARINAGARQLTFECLPAAIDVASLQVSADAHVRIGDYKTLLQPRDVAGKSCASPLETQIRALEDQLAAIHADTGASTLVASYLQGLTQPGAQQAPWRHC